MRLVLSATAASAVLYGAIVLFGVGSASPSALDTGGSDRHASVVLTRSHVDIVSGSVQKLPQASPEPGRNRPRVRPHRPRPAVVEATKPKPAAAVAVENKPAPVPTRGTESGPPSDDSSPTDPVAVPVPAPSVAFPAVVPALELPLPLPELPLPPALPLPPLQLPLQLPG